MGSLFSLLAGNTFGKQSTESLKKDVVACVKAAAKKSQAAESHKAIRKALANKLKTAQKKKKRQDKNTQKEFDQDLENYILFVEAFDPTGDREEYSKMSDFLRTLENISDISELSLYYDGGDERDPGSDSGLNPDLTGSRGSGDGAGAPPAPSVPAVNKGKKAPGGRAKPRARRSDDETPGIIEYDWPELKPASKWDEPMEHEQGLSWFKKPINLQNAGVKTVKGISKWKKFLIVTTILTALGWFDHAKRGEDSVVAYIRKHAGPAATKVIHWIKGIVKKAENGDFNPGDMIDGIGDKFENLGDQAEGMFT